MTKTISNQHPRGRMATFRNPIALTWRLRLEGCCQALNVEVVAGDLFTTLGSAWPFTCSEARCCLAMPASAAAGGGEHSATGKGCGECEWGGWVWVVFEGCHPSR